MQAHQQGIVFSEILVDAVLRAVHGESPGVEPWPISSPLVPTRTRADRDAVLRRLAPAMQAMCLRWQAVAPDETLRVVWPERTGPHGLPAQPSQR